MDVQGKGGIKSFVFIKVSEHGEASLNEIVESYIELKYALFYVSPELIGMVLLSGKNTGNDLNMSGGMLMQ